MRRSAWHAAILSTRDEEGGQLAILTGNPKDILPLLPEGPGVYLFRDQRGGVLYVGKGVSLKSRVRNYFGTGRSLTPRIGLMVQKIASVETIATDSEVEALILEANLIKEHRPPYNILLRDDKNYPYLRIGPGPHPRLSLVRSLREDAARYFGPYPSTGSLRENIKTLRHIFPLRTCTDTKMRTASRPCLDYHIGRCLAPCQTDANDSTGTNQSAYQATAAEMEAFLEGKSDSVFRDLRGKMRTQASALDFEGAARTRDRLAALEKISEAQKMTFPDQKDRDVVALAREEGEVGEAGAGATEAQVFIIRRGKLVGRSSFPLTGAVGHQDGEVVAAFLKQYYAHVPAIPPQILLDREPEEKDTIASWLTDKRGGVVKLQVPRRGVKRELVDLAARNARLSLAERRALENRPSPTDLYRDLGLPAIPNRIEGFDISNWSGREAVGSQVVFLEGRPARDEYRRYRIRSGDTPDDFRMLAEVIERCYRNRLTDNGPLPDLVLVDGGRGQVSAAASVLEKLGLGNVPLFGLAKKEELLFRPEESQPVRLPAGSSLRLLQAVRDEAHRFAHRYHQNLRRQAALASPLEELPGIGPKRRTALLRAFGSTQNLRRATLEELRAVPGLNAKVAQALLDHLEKNTAKPPEAPEL